MSDSNEYQREERRKELVEIFGLEGWCLGQPARVWDTEWRGDWVMISIGLPVDWPVFRHPDLVALYLFARFEDGRCVEWHADPPAAFSDRFQTRGEETPA